MTPREKIAARLAEREQELENEKGRERVDWIVQYRLRGEINELKWALEQL